MMSHQRKNVLATIDPEILEKNAPAFRSDSTWFALSKRARVVAISKDRVTDSEKADRRSNKR